MSFNIGHKFPSESHVARIIGEDGVDLVKERSHGVFCPIPIAGTLAYTYDGMIIPRMAGGGFTSLSDLISEATGGKQQICNFVKAGTTSAVGRTNSVWKAGSLPAAGGNGAALAAGTKLTRTSTGALKQANPGGSDTLHIVSAWAAASVAGQMLMVYDRLWHAIWDLSTASQAVASTADRYQTSGTAPGNFVAAEAATTTGAATPTVTIEYTNQDGTTLQAATSPAIVGTVAANLLLHAAPDWQFPLATGDTGIRNLTGNIVLSGASTGTVNLFLGHPLCWVPIGVANFPSLMDGINSAFNLAEVKTDACLAFLEQGKSATTATNWWGAVTMVSG